MTKISNQYSLTNVLTADPVNGRVGIGTASPGKPLEVYGPTLNTAQLKLFGASSTNGKSLYLGGYGNGSYITSGGTFSNGWVADIATTAICGIQFDSQNAESNIVFSTTTTNNTGPNERMRIAGNGNVGIGTSSPTDKLEVQDGNLATYHSVNAATAGYGINFYTNGGGSKNTIAGIFPSQVGTARSGNLLFYTSNLGALTERMRITSVGSVGINGNPGFFSNYVYFDIIGNSTTQGGLLQSRSSDDSTIGSFFANSNGLNVRTETSHPILFSPSGVERMRIASNGVVTFSSSAETSSSNMAIYASTNNNLYIQGSTGGLAMYADSTRGSGVGLVLDTASKIFSFTTNGSERMRITSGGNVLIGTTTDSSYRLTANGIVAALGSSCSLLFQNRTSTNTYEWYATSNTIYIYSSSAAANILSINGSNGTYTALSDINKKKDFEQSNIGLNEVLQLKPTLYRMKTDDESSIKELGFIAQEVKEFIPQAYNESGEGEDKFIGLNQMPLIAALTKSIQEQQTQINELKALLNA